MLPSHPNMSKLSLGFRVFVLYAIFRAQESQGYRFHPIKHTENAVFSLKHTDVKEKASNPKDMDPKLGSSTWSFVHTLLSGNDGDNPTLFAAHLANDSGNGYYGLVATMDVYGFNLNGGQLSKAAIWISNDEGDWKQDLDTITVGWLVYPSHFKDSHTHFFTYWTRDAYRNTGCLNMDCPGFQLASGSTVTPGDTISPVSDANGARQSITIKLFKDKSSGDWWLHYGFNSAPTVVGHFPASLFDSLSKKATRITFGGHVTYTKYVSSPPMGNGAFPSDKAASFWDLQFIGEDGNSTPINRDLMSIITDESSYSVSPIDGAKFTYGGPGGKSA
ncbi:hypothetical protein EJB05_23366 [Eragrostis curvula]|uniref:Neprosin PEP catalytic domain-containing protein n=1 Tax=Eragrostis curvula TaxID=38414 RepID=A0A5J9V7V9_9POAL|nr:hypothetical protein EJB05_23366 [Eragrostis curvula]